MIRRFLLIFSILSLFLAGCGESVRKPKFTIMYHQMMCNGTCPAYRLVLYDDGTVFYSGDFYVDVADDRVGTVEPEKIEYLLEEMKTANILEFDGSHFGRGTKGPTVVLMQIAIEGDIAYIPYVLTEDVPEEIRHIECIIKDITNSYQWSGEKRERCEGFL